MQYIVREHVRWEMILEHLSLIGQSNFIWSSNWLLVEIEIFPRTKKKIIKNVTLYQRNDPLVSLRSLDINTFLEYRDLNELDMHVNNPLVMKISLNAYIGDLGCVEREHKVGVDVNSRLKAR